MEVHIGEMERKSLKKSKGQHSAKTNAENSKRIFPEKELLGLSPNFHIHVSVSSLYIPRIGPHISCSRIGRLIERIYNPLTDT